MATTTLSYTGNTVSYVGIPDGTLEEYITGSGSIHTMVASGTTGQTALVEGSVDGSVWVTLSTMTVGASNAPDWEVIRHTFPLVRITGNAYVAMSRGL